MSSSPSIRSLLPVLAVTVLVGCQTSESSSIKNTVSAIEKHWRAPETKTVNRQQPLLSISKSIQIDEANVNNLSGRGTANIAASQRYHFLKFAALVGTVGPQYVAELQINQFNPCDPFGPVINGSFRYALDVVIKRADTRSVSYTYAINIDPISPQTTCSELSNSLTPVDHEQQFTERAARLAVERLFGAVRLGEASWSGKKVRRVKQAYPEDYKLLKRKARCTQFQNRLAQRGISLEEIPINDRPHYCRY